MLKRETKDNPRNPKERRVFHRKDCKFCLDKAVHINYKDDKKLRHFMTERGKIVPRRVSGNCAKHQRMLTTAIKRARHLALLPFISEHR
ncbi:MAG: 30S ribosomal protein S18 [Candidatus Edwardsbacteria bacterium RIFOXYD12_FULL_50_11]|uniref:Small ribosomal subunit protein bS18 n=1 Tax=Candidatus Edwardsbacteria bacterium GWF2_54_11 TaxID=1817851 RepID=A0A1F5R760_9BACT|nr:30S ribosomal protein S18 [Candidatus Edwardsbacteria bacterium]OGF05109.1 MAG: 30S ribosomal protein S18 [Candidatus Edwardsbacteria bacterium RifOxyC12_full_54_24]OGF08256.1 MAG: 30S ribosomal protein S18 [Candidatus Edwardsbacteria bacterium RifOxyA12_full_54_48]OGF10307.1 MAG: 30S ribosomal protein S18 [Candidatus Edwardsbacteria bacterium GWF2_54_11]OGF11553.1 MAG: 30S ribosomal protein S18 [Candidatus Edwardsbacteria bacterium GWE2_54_12]OGF17340.1 MAG: 30S ribosomal protein S18 [Cand